ncbi:MAG: MFS transporter [Lawsonibacter sp.]|nr:MFS transporter [Lawsonibacter sp.]
MSSRQSVRPWLVCLGGAVMLFSAMGLGSNVYSVYQPYIIAQGGFTNAQAAWIITVRSLFIVLGMLSAGWLCRRLGIRNTVSGAMVLLALSRFLFGAAGSLPAYLGAAALTGLAYSWAGMIPLTLLINSWFRSRNAFALGLASAGSGLATILIPAPLTWLIENQGLRGAFQAEGGLVLVLGAAVYALVRDDPARLGLEPYCQGQEVQRAPARRPAPGGMTPPFWALYLLAVFLTGAPTGIGISNVGVLYTTEGFDPGTVAALVSCVGLALMAGKMLYGELADRLGGRLASYLLYAAALLAYGLLCLAPNGSRLCAYAATALFGLALPLSNVSYSVWARDFLGDEGFAKGLKWSQSLYALGIMVFGPIPGWMADRTGGYVSSYLLFLAMMALSWLLIALVYRRTKSGGRP